MLRKLAIAGGSAALAYLVVAALPILDSLEAGDWDSLKRLGYAAGLGVAAAAARGVIAYLTAFVPSDSHEGVNLVGKYRNIGG